MSRTTTFVLTMITLLLTVQFASCVISEARTNGRASNPIVETIDEYYERATWELSDPSGYGSYGLELDGDGLVLLNESWSYTKKDFGNVIPGDWNQVDPEIAMDSKGHYVVAYVDGWMAPDIKAKVFDMSSGAEIGPNINIVDVGGLQANPSLEFDDQDRLVAIWDDNRDWRGNVRGSLFDISTGQPIGDGFWVVEDRGAKRNAMVLNSAGNAVVVWEELKDGDSNISLKVMDTDTGQPIVSRMSIANKDVNESYPNMVLYEDDKVVIIWREFSKDNEHHNIIACVMDPSSGQFSVDPFILASSITGYRFEEPGLILDENGNFIVVWADKRGDDGTSDIYAKRFKVVTGEQVGEELKLTDHAHSEYDPAISMDKDGNLLLAWVDDRRGRYEDDVFSKVIDLETGDAWQGEVQITRDSKGDIPAVAAVGNGFYLVIWPEYEPDSSMDLFQAQVYYQFGNDYLEEGYLVTDLYSPPEHYKWTKITADVDIPDPDNMDVTFYYSTSDGTPYWGEVPSDGSLTDMYDKPGIAQFKAVLRTTNPFASPTIRSITVEYTTKENTTGGNMPPTASFTIGYHGPDDHLNVTFNSTSYDPDGRIIEHTWSFGDNTTGHGHSVTHRYNATGDFVVSLEVTDNKGSIAFISSTVSIKEPNRGPLIISYMPDKDPKVMTGGTVKFNVVGDDPDQDVLSYTWYKNGTPVWTNDTYKFKTKRPGVYNITVNISDGSLSVTREWTVTVKEERTTPLLSNTMIIGTILAVVLVILVVLMVLRQRKSRRIQDGFFVPMKDARKEEEE